MGYVEELLAPGEQTRLRTRRHWVVPLRWCAAALLLVALGVVMAALFGFGPWRQGAALGAGAGALLAAVGLATALPGLLRWSSELYLVTDRRVIQVEGILHKQALDSSLAQVNDVRLTQPLLGRLLGYGTLEIITAGESGVNRLDELPRPQAFKRAMMAASQERAAGPESDEGVRAAGSSARDQPPAEQPTRSAAERLAELEELRRRELISDTEYRDKRTEILQQL